MAGSSESTGLVREAPRANVNTPGAANSALKEVPKPGEGVDPNHPHAAHVRIVDRQHAIVESSRKKIAICGFASSTRGQIPVNDPEWEIWGMNQLYRHIQRADRWFDVHWNWDQELVPGTDHRKWIAECGIPVYMIDAHEDLPTTVRFPLDALLKEYSADYFTSTVAHMTALALWEIDRRVAAQLDREERGWTSGECPGLMPSQVLGRARELYAEYCVGYFGIDLVVGEEYFWQKACAEFWLGALAVGRGVSVYVPPQSALCKQLFRYGYETEPPTIIKPREVAAHGKKLADERTELLKRVWMLDGAMQVDEYWHELLDLRLRGADISAG
jgi:hypothetical protein